MDEVDDGDWGDNDVSLEVTLPFEKLPESEKDAEDSEKEERKEAGDESLEDEFRGAKEVEGEVFYETVEGDDGLSWTGEARERAKEISDQCREGEVETDSDSDGVNIVGEDLAKNARLWFLGSSHIEGYKNKDDEKHE